LISSLIVAAGPELGSKTVFPSQLTTAFDVHLMRGWVRDLMIVWSLTLLAAGPKCGSLEKLSDRAQQGF
jgi:hypothetical protein